MILLDTSVLVDSLAGDKRSLAALHRVIATGEPVLVPSLVLFEWLRGPRLPAELAAREDLFPTSGVIPFGADEARVSAKLYRMLPRARGREMDLAIAACAIVPDAELWTLNPSDFQDIPGLRLLVA